LPLTSLLPKIHDHIMAIITNIPEKNTKVALKTS
jgi:hypothetical protein